MVAMKNLTTSLEITVKDLNRKVSYANVARVKTVVCKLECIESNRYHF